MGRNARAAVTTRQQSRLEGVNRYSNRKDSAMTLRGIKGKVWFNDANEDTMKLLFAGECFILEKQQLWIWGVSGDVVMNFPPEVSRRWLRRSVCRRHFSAGTCYTPYYHMFFESPATTFRLVNHIRLSHHLRSEGGTTRVLRGNSPRGH